MRGCWMESYCFIVLWLIIPVLHQMLIWIISLNTKRNEPGGMSIYQLLDADAITHPCPTRHRQKFRRVAYGKYKILVHDHETFYFLSFNITTIYKDHRIELCIQPGSW